jgi:putative ATP-grasp target RiPP
VPSLDLHHASARFPLATPHHVRRSTDPPSDPATRPWGLRGLRPGRPRGSDTAPWRYDHLRQVAVDAAGAPLTVAAPTARSVTSGDGDEGPSEDWSYDYCPDEPDGC